MSNKDSVGGSVNLAGLVFIVFLFCKLTGYITWSWWWVTAPLWMAIPFVILVIILLSFGIFVFAGIKVLWKRFRRK